jgi:hypothetical protein
VSETGIVTSDHRRRRSLSYEIGQQLLEDIGLERWADMSVKEEKGRHSILLWFHED